MDIVKWWWRWILIPILKHFVRSQVPLQNNAGHSFYNNYNPNHYANVQSHPTYYSNNYYALQRRPYAATGAQRSHNMVDYHSRAGYMNSPYQQQQPPKVHSIIYANQMNNYGTNRVQSPRNVWAEWSTWSKCSKPCNGGVKTRIRICKSTSTSQYNNYSPNAGVSNSCVGYRRGYKACNTQICMTKVQMKKKKKEDRKALCAQQNDNVYHGVSYIWIPYMRAGLSECKLNCLADGHKIFKSFGNVDDGTMCGQKDGYICQNGQCKQKRETNQPPSKPTTKSTYGAASSAPTYPARAASYMNRRWVYVKKNIFKSNGMTMGYNHVLRLPRGSVNITIRELAPSYNYLALKVGDLFVLDGRMQITNKQFFAASSIFRYVATNIGGKTSEKISSPGSLTEEVDVMVLYRRDNINITYEYALPMIEPNNNQLLMHPSAHQSIIHGVSHYPPQRSRYQQARLNSAPNYGYNPGQNNLPYSSGGNNGPYNSGQNNVPYNSPQINRRYNSAPNNRGYNSPILQPKPYRIVVPHSPLGRPEAAPQQVVYRWHIGGITKCTAKCNGGEQEYTYRCFASKGKSGKFVEDSNCQHLEEKPVKKRVCNMQACPVKWITTQWSKCSTVCGLNNTQQRTAVCKEFQQSRKSSASVEVDDKKCSDIVKPILVKNCDFTPCDYNWNFGKWEQCSKSCDFGIQRRYVYCQDSNGRYFPQDKCEESTKPNSTQSCLEAHCSAEWFVSEWGICSSACGSGIQTRSVFCRSSSGLLLAERLCQHKTKPAFERSCTGSICRGGFWVTSEWSKCSTHCGSGSQYRKVFCAAANGNSFVQVPDKMCSSDSKPSEMKQCDNKNCQPQWFTTTWEKCSVKCGRGIQRRQRICMSDDGKSARGCYYQSRPTLLQFCSQPSCTNAVFGVGNGERGSPALSRFTPVVQRKYRPSLRVQSGEPFLLVRNPTNSMTKATTTATTTRSMPPTTAATSPIKIVIPTTKKVTIPWLDRNHRANLRIQEARSSPVVSSKRNSSDESSRKRFADKKAGLRSPVIKRYSPKKILVANNTKDFRIVASRVTNKTQLEQRSRVISSNNRVNVINSVVSTTQPPRIDNTHKNSNVRRVPKGRANERLNTETKKKTAKSNSANSKNSSEKTVSKQCIDVRSKQYCKVIAERLKFCKFPKFQKLCCTSCSGKGAKWISIKTNT